VGYAREKYMYRDFQNVSPKKYCHMYIQLPCHDAKLLFVESEGGRALRGAEGGKEKAANKK
jgi:hypothetical protein